MFEKYYKLLHLVPVIGARWDAANEWVKMQYGGHEAEYDEKTQNWVGTPYYFDEGYLWRKINDN